MLRLEANEFAIPQQDEMLSLTTIAVKADFTEGAFWARNEAYRAFTYRSIQRTLAMDTRLKRQRAAERAPSADPAALALDQTDSLKLGTLDGHLGYFLRRLQVSVFKDFIRTLAPMDVRPAQYSVLLLVEANPGRSQAAIGQALDIERARLARLLHVLEGRGWIERRAANGDGRSHSLFLTRGGEKALVRIKALAARHEAWLAEFVGSKRRTALLDLMKDFG
jgi:DNA-binding MarR family transcriptional regulator